MSVGWGQAKNEVIVLRPRIIKALEEGITPHKIFLSFVKENTLSISCATFYRHVKKIREELAASSIPASSPIHNSNNQPIAPRAVPSVGAFSVGASDQSTSSVEPSQTQSQSQNKPRVISDPLKKAGPKKESAFKFNPVPDTNYFD